MSLGSRAGKAGGRPAIRLLLRGAGAPPEPAVSTRWRALVGAPGGDLALEHVAAKVRPSPMAAKAEKSLLAAVVADDTAAMAALALAGGDLAPVAHLLLGLRTAGEDAAGASGALTAALDGGDPCDHRLLRRYLPGLQVCVLLAPGVPAILAADREAVVLLLAETLATQGRHLDAVSLLGAQPMTPLTALALAAADLAIGQNEAAVKLTEGVTNLDDVTALCLIARGVALRTTGRFDEALAAFDQAISNVSRHPGVVAAALEERANLLRLTGEDLAAQADVERIQLLEDGEPDGSDAVGRMVDRPGTTGGPEAGEAELSAARARVRRRITGVGLPGTFGGRHHRSYQPDVEAMLSAGQFDAAENLLLGLLDAVEDEAEETGEPIDPTFYLTLTDLFAHRGQRAEELATSERYERASTSFGAIDDAQALADAVSAMERLDDDADLADQPVA